MMVQTKKYLEMLDYLWRTYSNSNSINQQDINKQIKSLLGLCLRTVKDLNAANDYDVAYSLALQLKKYAYPVYGLDLILAKNLLLRHEYDAAFRVCQEELSNFPNNNEARMFLESLGNIVKKSEANKFYGKEFMAIYNLISSYTTLSQHRLWTLFTRAKHICCQDLPGDFLAYGSTGCGVTGLLTYVISSYSQRPRKVYYFDGASEELQEVVSDKVNEPGSFEHYADVFDNLIFGTDLSRDDGLELCRKLGTVHMVSRYSGDFELALTDFMMKKIAVSLMHIDHCDQGSVWSIIDSFYEFTFPNVFIQVDDHMHRDSRAQSIQVNEREEVAIFTEQKISEYMSDSFVA